MANCEQEVLAAATWFGEQLFEPNEQRAIFVDRLQVRGRTLFSLPVPCLRCWLTHAMLAAIFRIGHNPVMGGSVVASAPRRVCREYLTLVLPTP